MNNPGLDEAEQEDIVQKQLDKIREEYKNFKPEDIKIIDPAMGSGHILVYAFDVLMQIYESYGYSQREAAKSIVEQNLYGLDIDNRAYQLAYFAVMMKARQYNRRIINGETICHLYAIQESNDVERDQLKYFGAGLSDLEKNSAFLQVQGLLDTFIDAKEYGSILNVDDFNWELLRKFTKVIDEDGQMSLDTIGVEHTREQLCLLVEIGQVMGQKYHVVITNPPYMSSSGMSNTLFKYVKNNFASAKSDLFAVFIKKCGELCKINGFYSLITQHSWMFLSDYTKLRSEIGEKILINMAHLGTRAFDEISGEIVQTTAFTMRNNSQKNYNGTYLRLVDENSESLKQNLFLSGKNRYYSKFIDYAIIPGSPIVYWASRAILKNFKEGRPMNSLISPRQGLATTDNKKFLRLWYEVSLKRINFDIKSISEAAITEIKWVPYNKGGSRRQWYGNYDYVVDWSNNGKEIKDNVMNKYTYLSSPDFVVKNTDFYFREAITWSLIASNGFSIRYRTPGSIHDVSGMSAFSDNRNLLMYILGLMSTKIANHIFKMLNPTINLQIGDFNNFPVITTEHADIPRIVNDSIKIAKEDWDSFETSWDFRVHPLINSNSIEDAYKRWKDIISSRFSKLKQNEEELNQIFIKIYGLERELTAAIEDEEITIRRENINEDIRSLISYAVGCIFGRYSLDVEGITFAGDNWDENKYKSYIPDKDNIIPITDEEYFQDDIIERIVSFIRIIYGESKLEENLNFIARVLNEKGDSSREVIRTYFVKSFFKDHCKVYQKRPIYWLFDSGKQNGFKALVYMHRFDENTIGNLRIDYLHRLQRIYENEIGRMQDAIENSDDAREVTAATKRKEKLIKQLQETKEYDEKIAHLALARTPIDLDDGVKVNYEKVQTDRDGKKLDVLAKI